MVAQFTHEQLTALRLASLPDGNLFSMEPDGTFTHIGTVNPELAKLMANAAAAYTVLSTVQLVLTTFLETADLIQEHYISQQLEKITASVDLVLKISRGELDVA